LVGRAGQRLKYDFKGDKWTCYILTITWMKKYQEQKNT
jgi:hypothetical protein